MYTNQSQCGASCQGCNQNQNQCGGQGTGQNPCTPPNFGPNCQTVANVNTGSGQTFNQVIDVPGTQSQLTTTNYYNNCYRKVNHFYVTDYKYDTNYYVEYNVYHRTPVNITSGNHYLGTQNIECIEGGNGNNGNNGNNGGCGCQPQPPCNQPSYNNSGCVVRSRNCY